MRPTSVISSNGLAVSANGRYLFANQTFQPAAIQRVDMTDPTIVEKYAAPGPEDIHAGLDGLTIDQNDRLFAATNGVSGQVWRVGTDRSICALSRAAVAISSVLNMAQLMRHVSDEYRGRVFSTIETFNWTTMMVSMMAG